MLWNNRLSAVFDQRKVVVVNKAERIQREARALWIETFGEPPGREIDSSQLLKLLFERLEPEGYKRLAHADRARNLTFPR
jgi:hypothetical protein